jgi:methylmalonyl-CoA mutase N-terminal domain/subunit
MTDPQQQYQPAQRDPNQPRQNVPVPDPSVLTTAALEREVGHLRELFSGQIEDIAKDLARFQDNHDERHRDVVGAAISHLKELCEVKFHNVETRFEERDLRFAQRDADSNEAIKAALAAAKEAVAKSEATFTKEIDAIKELISTTAKVQDQQIRDIKD